MRGPHLHYSSASNDAVQDFAFADTVVANELDEAMPPSGIVISDETGHHCMVPLAYPPVSAPAGLTERTRIAWIRMREGLRASRTEMNALWNATASVEYEDEHRREDPIARAAAVGRRVRTFVSFFEWNRADLLRAAWIGLFVFVLAATAGAFALQAPPADSPTHTAHTPRMTRATRTTKTTGEAAR